MRIAFLLPRIDLAGGIFIVLEHARGLARHHGHDVTIVVTEDNAVSHPYPSLSSVKCVGIEEVAGQEFDLAVATWWHTVYSLPRVVAPRYAHFIQNLEDRFYLPSEIPERAGASAVQTLPLAFIATAGWLEKQLRLLHPEAPIYCVRSGIDKDAFKPSASTVARGGGPLRIALEGPAGVWFKAVPAAIEAVQRMREPRHLTVVAYESPTDEIRALADRVEVRLSHVEMADVFRDVDVLLKLSRLEGMAGPPLEAFHCGATAVMTPVTGSDEYGEHGVNCMIVGYDDMIGTARTLDLLARDRPFLTRLRTNALATAGQWPSWQQATEVLDTVLTDIADSPPCVDARYTRQLTLETYAMYRRLAETQAPIAPQGIAEQVLWVWQREGATGVAARSLAKCARGLREPFRRLRSYLSHVGRSHGKDDFRDAVAATQPSKEDASNGLVPSDDASGEMFLHAYVPREGDIVVDAGVGNGEEVLTLSRLVGPSGKVIAVEAHPEAFNDLRELCEREELGNVELVHAALAATSGVTKHSDMKEPLLDSTIDPSAGLPVEARTLDEILRGFGITEVDILKMNIEGAEIHALEGFGQGIRRTRHVCIASRDFLMEDGRGDEGMRTNETVRELLESVGFDVTTATNELPWSSDYLSGTIRYRDDVAISSSDSAASLPDARSDTCEPK